MVAFSIVPFNVISFSVTSILAMLLYKKISVPLKKFALSDKRRKAKQGV